ncbi:hypothetical protein [Bifidobacterium longum]|uniref:hypothetical protein n=1 Tax=Bifidobacterium longum TaxID=216816 RepID=UPI0030142A19
MADVAAQVGEHDTRLWRFIRHYVDEAAKATGTSPWSPTRRSATWSAWCRARTRTPSRSSPATSWTTRRPVPRAAGHLRHEPGVRQGHPRAPVQRA